MEDRRIYGVSELTGEIKSLLEGKLSKIYVEAEISGWKLYPSGHAYFSLKDAGATIGCVMFASALSRCKARDSLADGAKVLVYANVSVYPPKGNYQLVVLAAKLSGVGDLMQRYLELKARLEKEGLFDPSKKRALPFLPRRIGIVTSEAGAVIHDMCTVMTRRFPQVEIRLYPSLVQGDAAPATLVAGIEYFNRMTGAAGGNGNAAWNADIIIIARGGGSFEDLFCFNDESLVRAVACSRIPVISAVGHETDYTLCDFAADRRAGTPSIAAEIAVPVLSELVDRLETCGSRLASALRNRGDFLSQRLDHLGASLASSLSLASSRAAQRLERADARLQPAIDRNFRDCSAKLGKLAAELALLSPYGVLERGYAIATDERGAILRDASSLAEGDGISVRLARGIVSAEVRKLR